MLKKSNLLYLGQWSILEIFRDYAQHSHMNRTGKRAPNAFADWFQHVAEFPHMKVKRIVNEETLIVESEWHKSVLLWAETRSSAANRAWAYLQQKKIWQYWEWDRAIFRLCHLKTTFMKKQKDTLQTLVFICFFLMLLILWNKVFKWESRVRLFSRWTRH